MWFSVWFPSDWRCWGGGVLGDLARSQHFAVMHWWTFTLVRFNLDIQSWFLQNAWLSRISAITLSSPPCQVLFRSSKLLILFEQKPCFAAPVIEHSVCQLFPTNPRADAYLKSGCWKSPVYLFPCSAWVNLFHSDIFSIQPAKAFPDPNFL